VQGVVSQGGSPEPPLNPQYKQETRAQGGGGGVIRAFTIDFPELQYQSNHGDSQTGSALNLLALSTRASAIPRTRLAQKRASNTSLL
jgi:hypothetical protein